MEIRPRKWRVVSFYTTGTGYEREVKKLIASLDEFGLERHIFACAPRGSWRQNLNWKSEIIGKAFDMFPGQDIVFIDADAVVRQDPVLFDKISAEHIHDVAAHYHPYRMSAPGGSLLSGTLWLANTMEGRRLVDRWHAIGVSQPTVRHQHCLQLAINDLNQSGFPVRVYRLPRAYTLIFDYYRTNRPDPVIEHFQASRRFKREVGQGDRLLNSNFKTLDTMWKGARRAPGPFSIGGKNVRAVLTTKGMQVVTDKDGK